MTSNDRYDAWRFFPALGCVLLITVCIFCLSPSYAADRCPPLRQSSLLLPSDKLFARKYFIDKAKKLNESGRCVVGGGFDNRANVFYFNVTDTDNAQDITVLRFTFREMSKLPMDLK